MPRIPIRTWVLIADAAHARVVERQGTSDELKTLKDMVYEIELPPSRDLLTDKPGRSFESQGRARHAKENRADPHRELKRAFAKKIATILEAKLREGQFDRLVLVAPPVTLGDLREALPKSVRAKVTAELPHDLVKTPTKKLWPHLEEVLPRPAVTRTPRRSSLSMHWRWRAGRAPSAPRGAGVPASAAHRCARTSVPRRSRRCRW